MVNRGQQLRIKRIIERLFAVSSSIPVVTLEKELHRLGFAQTGGDMAALQFENRAFDLILEIHIDENRCVHGYQILTSGERAVPQGKFRW